MGNIRRIGQENCGQPAGCMGALTYEPETNIVQGQVTEDLDDLTSFITRTLLFVGITFSGSPVRILSEFFVEA